MYNNQHIFLVTGGVHGGKSTFLAGLILQLRRNNLSVSGFVSEGAFSQQGRSSFTLVNVENGERHDLASVEEKEGWMRFGRFYFNPGAIAEGEQIIKEGLDRNVDLVVVDEVGPFELNGDVWSDMLGRICSAREVAQIWVVREQILDEVLKRWNIPAENVTRLHKNAEEELIKKITSYVRNDESGPAT